MDLVVPDNCSPQTQEYVNRATKYLKGLTSKHNPSRQKHDLKRPCIVCKKPGHTFEDCKVLKNHAFLCDALIKSSFYFEKMVKRRAAVIADKMEAKHASREKKQLHLLHSVRTMRAIYDSDSDSDSDSDTSSEARYLDEDSGDEENFC
jgi:hypothetical protein